MNGYELTRGWYNFKFQHPDRVRAVHSDFYFYIVDLWNRLGQKKQIGLPTSVTMQMLGIGSYNTYKVVLQDLIDFGFLELISTSKNQHQARVVALSKIDKATDTALDVALSISDNPTDETSDEPTDKATDDIIEQLNNRIIEYPFASFWDLYDKKKDTSKCKKKWDNMTSKELSEIMNVVKSYVESTPEKKFRKNPLTWLNGECWLDEITVTTFNTTNTLQPTYSQW